jgi:hypothetical protein
VKPLNKRLPHQNALCASGVVSLSIAQNPNYFSFCNLQKSNFCPQIETPDQYFSTTIAFTKLQLIACLLLLSAEVEKYLNIVTDFYLLTIRERFLLIGFVNPIKFYAVS